MRAAGRRGVALAALLAAASGAWAEPVARRIGSADGALLFGGGDAAGGVGDWYVSNGVVEAVIDDAGPTPDLVGILPPGTEPAMQSSAAPTGGTLIDLGLVGAHDDQLSQMFTVGGLSTENFVVFDAVTAPAPGVVRASGKLRLPPESPADAPCIDAATEYRAEGTDPYLTVVTSATNACGVTVPLGGFLDAFIWTQRSLLPFSAGGGLGGRGFDHPVLDFANPAAALETPTFLGAPGVIRPEDGVVDPARGLPGGEVAYGLLGVDVVIDSDGPDGPSAPVATPVDAFLGVSSNLVTALGNAPGGPLEPGGTIVYTRRLYVGGHDDVRAVSDPILTDLAPRLGLALGTLSGDVDAADASDVRASILVVRLGRCADASPCRSAAECGGSACTDPVPVAGFSPGGAVTHVRTAADGTFSGVVLPNGDYELVVSAPERDDVVRRPVQILDADTAAAIPPLSARGTLAFRVREKRRGKPLLPAKLVLQGLDGTPDPRFGHDLSATLGGEDLLPETFGGTQRGQAGDARGQGNVVYTTTGEGSIEVRPGRYAVWASRGMEYGIGREEVTIEPGATVDVDFLLKRVIKSRDAVGADFHVHSVRSFDSSTPLEDRVASFVAEGVEVMVSSDHDEHVDYEPVIESLGLASRVLGVPGVEVTGSVPNPPVFPDSIGHLNGWPMPVQPDARRDGAIDDEYVAPNWIYSRLADLGGDDIVIQYNHVRAGVSGLTSIGFFNSIGCGRCANAIDTTCSADADCPAGAGQECTCVGYQPDRPIDAPPNDLLLDGGIRGPGTTPNPDGHVNLDFDVMEIANGARASDVAALVAVRRDWFSLLRQNIRKWGTGVSDSHRATIEHAGWARTFVLGAGDDPRAISLPTFDAQVRAGAMVIAAGPYLEVSAKAGRARAGVGEELPAPRGKVRLRIRVTAPAWVPVDEVRIVVNGEVAERFDATTRPRVRPMPRKVTSSGRTVRFRTKRTLRLDRDAFVVVEAGIPLPGPGDPPPVSPDPMNVILPGAVPFAIANPIFVDVGADGWEAPGLPAAAALRAGRMTGVARADRAAAIRRGEYLPLWTLDLSALGPAR